MEFFFIFVFIVILIFVFGARHNARVSEAWAQAANELHLKFEKRGSGALEMRGSRAGYSIVIGTTFQNKTRWTEFNLRFNKALPVSFELKKQHFLSGISKSLLNAQDIEVGDLAFDEKAIISGKEPEEIRDFLTPERRDHLKRLFDRFDGYRITDSGIKVEDHSLIANPQDLVRATKLLFGTAKAMLDNQAKSPPIPPPLPNRTSPPVDEPGAVEAVRNKPEVPEESPPVPSPNEMAEPAAFEEIPIQIEEEAVVPAIVQPSEFKHEVSDFACDILDLFTMHTSHYAISTAFTKLFLNEKISSSIIPQRVEKYFLDRIFGRGPGFLLRGEICVLENGKPISLVIAYPEEESLSDLRATIGTSHAFSGTLVKCDTFSREIFVIADLPET
ncbi:hypothetical protein VSU19_19475 [Verrucomicrobiales bacterium BCK34]|nr:hypothetical protein [Verrucomicrobiales bacterium BCK34]